MKIFMIPRNHEYINRLVDGMRRKSVDVVLLKPFHYSTPGNLYKMLVHRRRGCDLIHVHWLYIFPHRLVMDFFNAWTRRLGIKVVWEVHNILPHRWSEADRTISRRFLERADGLILHNGKDLERIGELLGVEPSQPHVVAPHGNFIGSYRNDVPRDAARSRLGIGSDEKVLLCFGIIRRNRGYECLFDAMERVEGFSLIVAGRIEDKDTYREIARRAEGNPRIRVFTGWIPDDDVQIYFRASDVVVLPYTEITTSGVLPLAYSFGKPVITTSVGGMNDMVTRETGRVVPPKDPDRLAEAIREIFTEDHEEMGKSAYRFADEKLGWDRNVDLMIEFYGKVRDGSARQPHAEGIEPRRRSVETESTETGGEDVP